MTEVWITIAVLAVATAVIKASGPVVFGGRSLPDPALRVISLLAAALLAALVVTQTFTEHEELVLDARAGLTHGGAVLNTDAEALPGVPRLTLHVGLPQSATPEQIRDVVQSWLQRQARRVFEERCKHFAQQLGVRYTKLSLSSAQTRWGSAGADGAIRLNWRLIHFAMAQIDYVVAHELAHLREMNHSPRFWDVVRSVMPDYERVRSTLKDDTLPVFD